MARRPTAALSALPALLLTAGCALGPDYKRPAVPYAAHLARDPGGRSPEPRQHGVVGPLRRPAASGARSGSRSSRTRISRSRSSASKKRGHATASRRRTSGPTWTRRMYRRPPPLQFREPHPHPRGGRQGPEPGHGDPDLLRLRRPGLGARLLRAHPSGHGGAAGALPGHPGGPAFGRAGPSSRMWRRPTSCCATSTGGSRSRGSTIQSRREYRPVRQGPLRGREHSELDFRQAESELPHRAWSRQQRQIAGKEHEISVLIGRPPGDAARPRPDQNLPPPGPRRPAVRPAPPPPRHHRRRDGPRRGDRDIGEAKASSPADRPDGRLRQRQPRLRLALRGPLYVVDISGGLLQPIFNAGQNRRSSRPSTRACAQLDGNERTILRLPRGGGRPRRLRRFTESRAGRQTDRGAEEGAGARRDPLQGRRERVPRGPGRPAPRFDAEIEEADTIAQLVSLIFLYKALGGGWAPRCTAPPAPPPSASH